MGYYTNYKLTIHQDGDSYVYVEDAKKEIKDHIDYDPFIESCKWYDHNEDMIWLSEQHPGTVFLLEGEGEESGDIWRKYFKDGKGQYTKGVITFEDYNPKKLQ